MAWGDGRPIKLGKMPPAVRPAIPCAGRRRARRPRQQSAAALWTTPHGSTRTPSTYALSSIHAVVEKRSFAASSGGAQGPVYPGAKLFLWLSWARAISPLFFLRQSVRPTERRMRACSPVSRGRPRTTLGSIEHTPEDCATAPLAYEASLPRGILGQPANKHIAAKAVGVLIVARAVERAASLNVLFELGMLQRISRQHPSPDVGKGATQRRVGLLTAGRRD